MKDATTHRFLAFFYASRTRPSYLTTCSEREGPFSAGVEVRGKQLKLEPQHADGKRLLVKSPALWPFFSSFSFFQSELVTSPKKCGSEIPTLGRFCQCFHAIYTLVLNAIYAGLNQQEPHPRRLAAQKGNLDGGSKPSSSLAQVLNKGLLGKRILEANGGLLADHPGWFFMFGFYLCNGKP